MKGLCDSWRSLAMMNYGDLEKAFNTIHNPRNWFLDKASQIGKSDLSGPAIDHTLLAQYGHVLSASSTDVPAMTTYLVQSPVIDLLRKVSEYDLWPIQYGPYNM